MGKRFSAVALAAIQALDAAREVLAPSEQAAPRAPRKAKAKAKRARR